jgi:hypothetical protein
MLPKRRNALAELHLRVPAELMDDIVAFRHDQRMASRQEAVVALLRLGLGTADKGGTKKKIKRTTK